MKAIVLTSIDRGLALVRFLSLAHLLPFEMRNPKLEIRNKFEGKESGWLARANQGRAEHSQGGGKLLKQLTPILLRLLTPLKQGVNKSGTGLSRRIAIFGIRILDLIRISDFEFRIFPSHA